MPLLKTIALLPLLSLSILLASCISIPQQNIDPNKNNKTTFQKDLGDCKEDYPEAGSGMHYRQWSDCMQLKGWR